MKRFGMRTDSLRSAVCAIGVIGMLSLTGVIRANDLERELAEVYSAVEAWQVGIRTLLPPRGHNTRGDDAGFNSYRGGCPEIVNITGVSSGGDIDIDDFDTHTYIGGDIYVECGR